MAGCTPHYPVPGSVRLSCPVTEVLPNRRVPTRMPGVWEG